MNSAASGSIQRQPGIWRHGGLAQQGYIGVALLALFSSAVMAEEGPRIPDEATKVWALKRAYQLNGNSMVGNNRMIDLSNETPFANPVQTERILVPMPKPAPSPEAELAKMTSVTDVCARHGLHKVTVRGGKSWRCR